MGSATKPVLPTLFHKEGHASAVLKDNNGMVKPAFSSVKEDKFLTLELRSVNAL